MIKKLLFMLFIPVLLIAQDQKNTSQNIELPEFVITGVERVSLPVVLKPKAELIPVLSEDFFKPVYPPEHLQMAAISDPVSKNIDLTAKPADFNGRVRVGIGTVSIPTGLLSYGTSYKYGSFFGKVYGLNQREYVDNAGINNSGVELNNTFFVNTTSSFMPGAKFNIGGTYYRESYRYYASFYPDKKNDLHSGEIHAGAEYLSDENFKFGIQLSDRPLKIKGQFVTRNPEITTAAFSENTFEADMFAEGGFRNFQLIGRLNYIGQTTDEHLGKKNGYNYISPSAYLRFKDTDNYKLEFGFNLTSFNSETVFQPHAFFGLKLNNRFSFFAEYKPQTQLMTIYDILKENRFLYIDFKSADNFFIEEKVAFKFALRYEYETFFEIDGGFRYTDFNHFPYYSDENFLFPNFQSIKHIGIFDIKSMEARRFTGFVNMLFHLGPFGVFYGDAIVEEFKNDQKKYVPYQPVLRTNLNYGYKLPFGLKTEAGLFFASKSYSDSLNSDPIPAFIDLSLHFSFEIIKNFDLFSEVNNLLNRKNYYWKNYRERPVDLIVGIDYRW